MFDKVLIIGPHYNAKGGIASVINTYREEFDVFHFLPTMSSGNKLEKLFILIKSCFLFPYYIYRYNIKIVHIHTSSYVSFYRKSIFILLALLFNRQIICHIHAGNFLVFYEGRNKKFISYLLNKCTRIIVLSENIKKDFETKTEITTHKIKVIHNMISSQSYIKRDYKSEINFLFMGHIYKEKGIFDLVKLFKDNYSNYKKKFKLIIAGGLYETNELLKFINDNKLNDIIIYEGWASGEKKENLFKKANIFILPSYNEALPMSILEAMSYSLPIISTKVGAIPEIVKNRINGFLFEAQDNIALKEIIDLVDLNRDLLNKMGQNSYNMSTQYFPNKVITDLSNVYKDLL